MASGSIQHGVKLWQASLLIRPSFNHDVISQPTSKPPPGPNVDLDPVVLNVGTSGHKRSADRHHAGFPSLAAIVEVLPVRRFARLCHSAWNKDPVLGDHLDLGIGRTL